MGPAAGLAIVDGLMSEPALKAYHLLPSVRGDLLVKLGRLDEARPEFERAAAMTRNARERELLLRRAGECGRMSSGSQAACPHGVKRARSSRFSASGRRSGATSADDARSDAPARFEHRAAVRDLRPPFGDQPQRQRIKLVLGLEHARGQRLPRCRRPAPARRPAR